MGLPDRLRGLEDFEGVCIALAEGVFDGSSPLDAAELLQSIRREDCEAWLREHLGPERLALSIIEPRRS